MSGYKFWGCAWICWLGWMAMCHGQNSPGWLTTNEAPLPPESGFRDDSGIFARDPDTLKRITERIAKLRSDHDFRLFVVVQSVIIGSTPPEMAAKLQQAWVPDGNGLVVVCEADSRKLGFGRATERPNDPAGLPSGVPAYETVAVLARVMETVDAREAPESYLESLVTGLAEEFDRYFERRKTPPPPGRALRFWLLGAGGIALLGLAAAGVISLVRRTEGKVFRTYRFPKADLPERLGAPFGGGDVTARRFDGRDADDA